MAISYTTSGTTLANIGKKIQGKALKGFAKRSETWGWFKELDDLEIDFSQREVTTPIDIIGQPNGAFISEFGSEANPYTAAPVDLTFVWAFLNHRFTFSRTSFHLGRKAAEGMIVKQSVWQTQKLMESMTRRVGLGMYGFSTGVICQTTTVATQASGTYTLSAGFGQSAISDATYLAQPFEIGDVVALVRAGALVPNAVGPITAVSKTGGTIDVAWAGSVTSASGDNIVFANAYPENGNLTLAGATEYNKAPFGLIEMMTSTTVHNLSGSTYARWNPAGTDSTGSYLTGTRIKKAQHLIKVNGGGKLDTLILALGVARALFQQTYSAVKYSDPLGMEVLGSVNTKSIKQIDSDPLCPPTYAFGLASPSFRKWVLTEIPDEGAKDVSDSPLATVDKLQGVSGHVLSLDFIYNFVTTRRADGYMWSGLTEA